MFKAKVTTQLRIRREKKRLSLALAAERIGVTIATLSRWETGKRTPPPRYWPGIKAVYGVEVNRNTLAAFPVEEASA